MRKCGYKSLWPWPVLGDTWLGWASSPSAFQWCLCHLSDPAWCQPEWWECWDNGVSPQGTTANTNTALTSEPDAEFWTICTCHSEHKYLAYDVDQTLTKKNLFLTSVWHRTWYYWTLFARARSQAYIHIYMYILFKYRCRELKTELNEDWKPLWNTFSLGKSQTMW